LISGWLVYLERQRREAESMMQARPPEFHKDLFKLSPEIDTCADA
jgi:hypothetical protein